MADMLWRIAAGVLIAMQASACSRPESAHVSQPTLALLSREGCMMTGAMRTNLDAAIRALGRPITYDVIDLGTLPRTDVRVAYPTPTLLARGRDVFGLPEPTPPFPEPT
jgi:hypothetical protein